MAKGKKYSDEIKEQAYALLSTGDNVQTVAKKLHLPYSSVNNWYLKWKDGQDDEDKNLEEVRNKNKENFVNNAWSIIDTSMLIAQKRVERAFYLEKKIDAVADAISKHSESIAREAGTTWDELIDLVKELKNFKAMRVGELSSLIGILFDKQALINKDPTSIVETKRFEDF